MVMWFSYLGLLLLTAGVAWLVVLWMREHRGPRVVCLMYHRFAPRKQYEQLEGTERVFTVSIEDFEQQIATMRNAGYTFVSAEQVRQFACGRLLLPQPCAMITVDDGCRSVAELALPVLERHAACATVFVTTDPESHVFSLGGVRDERISDAKLRKLDGRALRFESHAVTHRPLRGLPDEELCRELADSRAYLRAVLGREPEFFAVPGNWFNARVLLAARQAGYSAVWCSNPGAVRPGTSLFPLPRLNVDGCLSIEEFRRLLEPAGIVRKRFVSWIRRVPGRILGPRWWSPMRRLILRSLPRGYLPNHLVFRAVLVLAAGVCLIATLILWRGVS